MSQAASTFHVLLIEEDPKEADFLSDLIRRVADANIDVMSRMASVPEWIGRSSYHLVVISEGAAGRALPLLEQVKRVSPATAVVVVSAHAGVEQAVAAIRMGAEDYLRKPFNPESFQLAVKRGLDRKAVFGEDEGASSLLNLINACQMISASLEQKKIFEIVQSFVCRELKSVYAAVYSLHDDVPIRVSEWSASGDGDRTLREVLEIALNAVNPLTSMAQEAYRFVDKGQLTPGLFAFRFQCAGESDYFCVCISPTRPGGAKRNIESFEGRLRILKAQIEVTGKSIEHYLGVQRLVYVDDATGLYNTRYLNYILDREIAQAKSSERPFAVLFIDADHFKSVNDHHGHVVGTKLLNELGHLLKKLVRENDTVFRYGGDEFVAVLSGCDLATAKSVAERVRSSVEQKHFLEPEGLNLRLTVSIGVALFPDHARTKKAIIDSADVAMYESKKKTRNAVTVARARKAEAATK